MLLTNWNFYPLHNIAKGTENQQDIFYKNIVVLLKHDTEYLNQGSRRGYLSIEMFLPLLLLYFQRKPGSEDTLQEGRKLIAAFYRASLFLLILPLEVQKMR